MPLKTTCPKCGSDQLRWDTGIAVCTSKIEVDGKPCDWRGYYPDMAVIEPDKGGKSE